MPKPTEHKTVQARILHYAQELGWRFVSRTEAEQRRGFDPQVEAKHRARGVSLFFDQTFDQQVRTFNPRFTDTTANLLASFSAP